MCWMTWRAISAWALSFGILEARTAGKKIPQGVAIDGQGNPTDDPMKVLGAEGGAINTFDGGQGRTPLPVTFK